MDRRAQAEIVGLLVIVLILSFLLLFVFRSIASDKGDSSVASIKEKDFASDLLGAMLSTSTNCTPNSKVEDLLVDCGKFHHFGGQTGMQCYDGRSSCDFFNESVVDVMLNETLKKMEITYEFIVTQPNSQDTQDKMFYRKYGDLGASLGGSSVNYLLPIDNSGQSIHVMLCIGGCGDIA